MMPSELPTTDTPRPDRCETCRFFWLLASEDEYDVDDFRCRRYPPVLTREDNDGYASHPRVFESDWCGEWQPNKKLMVACPMMHFDSHDTDPDRCPLCHGRGDVASVDAERYFAKLNAPAQLS